jgi:hypothetical protein
MSNLSQEDILQELKKDEELLWHGRPGGGIKFRVIDIFLVPFSLFWGGGVIFLEYGAISSGANILFPLLGIPFVLIGLYLLFGRFYIDLYRRKNTWYALTNSRLLIIQKLRKKNVKSINLSFVTHSNISEDKDGSGTITVNTEGPMSTPFDFGNKTFLSFIAGEPTVPTLEYISDVREVYNLLMSAVDEKY